MRKTILILSLSVFFATNLLAQVLQKTVEKFKRLDNLAYSCIERQKDLFSDEIIIDTLEAKFDISNSKNLFKISGNNAMIWYDGTKLIRFNTEDSTYKILEYGNSIYEQRSLPKIIKSLAENLQKKVPIIKLSDSIVEGKGYYRYKITEFDSLKNEKRVFRFKKILIDKDTYLPLFLRVEEQGFLGESNTHLELFTEYHFKNYQTNDKMFPDLSLIRIPKNFEIEKPKKDIPLLVNGVPAPKIEVLDSTGSIIDLINQKGKVILLNFSLVGCGHCIESVEMLNELYSTLAKNNFVIITIYPVDSDESVRKTNIQFKIKYPFFSNFISIKAHIANYHLSGYPTFYIIDKKGEIVNGFSGYSKSIEFELRRLIKESL